MFEAAKYTALLTAEKLPVNESIRMQCPACGRNTFSVTRLQHSVAWNCFRATCNTKGHEVTHASLVKPAQRTPTLRPYTKPLYTPEQCDIEFFRERFDLSEHYVYNYIRVTEDDRYAYPIRDYRGYERGVLVREPNWSGTPHSPRAGTFGAKALTYMHSNGPVQSWCTVPYSRRLVLVEDTLSALKVMQAGVSALALLGTHLNNDKVREIGQWQPSEVIIALDADATTEAFKLARKWGLAFPKTRVAILAKDLKDEPRDDIKYILGIEG